MKDLTLWKDEQFRQIRADLDGLFRDFLCDFSEPGMLFLAGEAEVPQIELTEESETVTVRMNFPGLDPADLVISVSPEVLIITADRSEQQNNATGAVRRGRRFSQRIKLPCRVEPEGAEALCFDHRLEIRLPKSQAAAFRNLPLRRVRK